MLADSGGHAWKVQAVHMKVAFELKFYGAEGAVEEVKIQVQIHEAQLVSSSVVVALEPMQAAELAAGLVVV